MSSVPSPLRAALGLALTVVDTARDTATHLPQLAAGLPIAVASQAVQLSLRAQQQYAAYVNKGDELIGTLRGAPEEAPSWATFDEDTAATAAGTATATPARNTAFDRVPDADDEPDEPDELTATDELVELVATIAEDETGSGLAAADPVDAALDLLDGSYEAANGPAPTPGAPDTVPAAAPADGPPADEVIAADAPRTTASREPAARKAARKTATKTSRKTAPRPAAGRTAPAAGRGTATTAPAGGGAPAAKRATKKAAAKAAPKAARPVGATEPAVTDPVVPRTTLEGEPLPAAAVFPDDVAPPVVADVDAPAAPPSAQAVLDPRPPLPASPDSAVSDTQPSPEAEI